MGLKILILKPDFSIFKPKLSLIQNNTQGVSTTPDAPSFTI